MTKKTKVAVAICGGCAMLGGAGYFAYKETCNYIFNEKCKSWREGFDLGLKRGEASGKSDALWQAKSRKYITYEQYDELIKMN